MKQKKKAPENLKPKVHPRNKNNGRYDFPNLITSFPDLKDFVILNPNGEETINFADADAVKCLNKALLIHHYGISYWDIPDGYLCPPIPGRTDYIHHLADLACRSNFGKIPQGKKIKVLDVGVGANCIYPIIGVSEYDWSFIGSDIDPLAVQNANEIISTNDILKENVICLLQQDKKDYFYGIILKEEKVDFTMCNPPFHASWEDAQEGTIRKIRNLTGEKVAVADLNFGGQNNELWYEGGEARFVKNMIRQSKKFGQSVYWFSSLVSKQSNLKAIYTTLQEVGATEVETLEMGQGNKSSRVVAWSFLNKEEQMAWKISRWKIETQTK